MSLVKITDLLKKSRDGDYFIGAIECWNFESAIAIIMAAEKINSPVVLFTGDPAVKLMGMKNLANMMLTLAADSKVPVACHIEAVNDHTILYEAIKYGFPSVIYDGSELPFDQNIKNTKELVNVAHAVGVEVEAQIGSMPFSEGGTGYEQIDFSKHKTKLEEAELFAKETNIDMLAPNLGNVHGLYKQKIKELDIELANNLSDHVGLPITLHGGTGIPEDIIKKARSSKLSMMYLASSIFESFRICMRCNIDTKSGYGSLGEIGLECRDNLINYVIDRLTLMNSKQFFVDRNDVENLEVEQLVNLITNEIIKKQQK
jgi:fructose-bisphosphate aldolase class II